MKTLEFYRAYLSQSCYVLKTNQSVVGAANNTRSVYIMPGLGVDRFQFEKCYLH